MKRGEDDQAVVRLEACAREFPQSLAAHLALGRLLRRRGELSKAATEFQSTARLDPKNALAAAELGVTRMALKDYPGALKALRLAAGLAPRDASIHFPLFQCELELKHFDAAAETARRIVQSSPAVPEMFNRLAAEQVKAGDYRNAVSNLERASALDPANRSTRYNLALALFKSEQAARALAAAEPLRAPESAEMENLLGDIYEKLERPLDAVHAYQKAAELAPLNEDYRYDFIFEMVKHEAFHAAQLVSERAVVDFPQSQRLCLALGIALFFDQQPEKAASALFEAAQRFADPAPLLPMLVFVVEGRHERLDETEELLAGYRAKHPGNALALYLSGRVAVAQDAPDRAVPLLSRSVALNPRDADAQFQLGLAYEHLGQTRVAVERYREAARLRPDSSQTWYRLSQALRALGDKDGAGVALRRFSELHDHENEHSEVVRFLYQVR